MSTLQEMLPRHYKILDLVLDGRLTLKQIASSLNMTPEGVRIIRNSPTFQHELAMRREKRSAMKDELSVIDETEDIIQRSTTKAANSIVDLLDSVDEGTRLRSAESLLDRGGYPKVSKVDQNVRAAVVVLNAADVDRIARTNELDRD